MKITTNFIFVLIGMLVSNVISFYYLCECITWVPILFVGVCICISVIIEYFIIGNDEVDKEIKK
ncbi:MAG: hypothetical protein WCX79_00995 [Candidatus Paceibacterota bacterium]|jgi:hypothetical protein